MTIFKDFTTLNQTELEMILTWRNDTRINLFFKKQTVSAKEHFDFVEELKSDTSKKYFLVLEKENPIGVVNFVDINKEECELGLYQAPNVKNHGKILLQSILEYALNTFKLKRVKACVYNQNKKAMKLFLSFDFRIYQQDEIMSCLIKSF